MKTFRQFIEELLEDNKRSLTQDQIREIEAVRKRDPEKSRQLRRAFLSKSIRNTGDPIKQTRMALQSLEPTPDLGPNRFLRFDKTLNKWVQGE